MYTYMSWCTAICGSVIDIGILEFTYWVEERKIMGVSFQSKIYRVKMSYICLIII